MQVGLLMQAVGTRLWGYGWQWQAGPSREPRCSAQLKCTPAGRMATVSLLLDLGATTFMLQRQLQS